MASSDSKPQTTDAARFAEFARKQRRKHDKSLPQEAKDAVDASIDNLEATLKTPDKDTDAIQKAVDRLDATMNRYMAHTQKSTLREYGEAIGLAVLFALILRAFLVEAFIIPSASMEPTLQEGDRIFVNKFKYGVRLPFTTTRIIDFGPPERGDVIVFIFPRHEAAEHVKTLSNMRRTCVDPNSLVEEKDYIKRVIGLPGDTIKMVNNQVHINGKPMDRELLKRSSSKRPGLPYLQQQRESFEDRSYVTQHYGVDSHFAVDNPITVKSGHVFVMGDNRDNSSDGRCWGQVPIENIKGRAMVIWWSSNGDGYHWERLGQSIE